MFLFFLNMDYHRLYTRFMSLALHRVKPEPLFTVRALIGKGTLNGDDVQKVAPYLASVSFYMSE